MLKYYRVSHYLRQDKNHVMTAKFEYDVEYNLTYILP